MLIAQFDRKDKEVLAMSIKDKLKNFTPLRMLTLYLSMLIPKDKSLMLFGAWFGEKYADNAKYLYEYVLKNRKDLKPVWMTSSKDVYVEMKRNSLPVCMSGTIMGIKLAMRAWTVFYCTHDQEDIGIWETHFIGRSRIVNLWHGIPIKKIMYDDEYNSIYHYTAKDKLRDAIMSVPLRKRYLCSSSSKVTSIYKSAFRMNERNILEVGQPRNDYFISEHINPLRQQYKQSKIVVYLPTHRNSGKTTIDLEKIFDLDDLNKLLQESNAFLIIKKHPYHKKEKRMESVYSRIIEFKEEFSNTQEMLDAADILITDYSSCYIDYLFLKRPMIFYAYDYENYIKEDRQLYFDYDEIIPGPLVKNYSQFRNELSHLLCGYDEFKSKRDSIEHIFYDNHAGTLSSPKLIEILGK